jgi:hypothetical protein
VLRLARHDGARGARLRALLRSALSSRARRQVTQAPSSRDREDTAGAQLASYQARGHASAGAGADPLSVRSAGSALQCRAVRRRAPRADGTVRARIQGGGRPARGRAVGARARRPCSRLPHAAWCRLRAMLSPHYPTEGVAVAGEVFLPSLSATLTPISPLGLVRAPALLGLRAQGEVRPPPSLFTALTPRSRAWVRSCSRAASLRWTSTATRWCCPTRTRSPTPARWSACEAARRGAAQRLGLPRPAPTGATAGSREWTRSTIRCCGAVAAASSSATGARPFSLGAARLSAARPQHLGEGHGGASNVPRRAVPTRVNHCVDPGARGGHVRLLRVHRAGGVRCSRAGRLRS